MQCNNPRNLISPRSNGKNYAMINLVTSMLPQPHHGDIMGQFFPSKHTYELTSAIKSIYILTLHLKISILFYLSLKHCTASTFWKKSVILKSHRV